MPTTNAVGHRQVIVRQGTALRTLVLPVKSALRVLTKLDPLIYRVIHAHHSASGAEIRLLASAKQDMDLPQTYPAPRALLVFIIITRVIIIIRHVRDALRTATSVEV
jgi:hypothetical protein